MIVQVKVWMDIAVDPDEYAVPSDGDVREEIEDALREYINDINGMQVKTLRITQQKGEYNDG